MKNPLLVPLLALSLSVPLSAVAETPAIEPGQGTGRFLAKLEAGQPVHVAFLGGSITQNGSGHSKRVADWLKEKWPGVDFTFTNAGLASTCSVTGVFRFQRDVLSKGPVDLLIVEFAVNDDQDARHDRTTAIRGLEGILRQYFAANPEGDAISVQYVNPEILALHREGKEATSVAAHKTVARHYGIASVDVGLALAREIEAGRMSWENDYRDTHPNDTGYAFATGLIVQAIAAPAAAPAGARELPEPLDPGCYDGAAQVDPQSLSWLGGWRYAPVSKELLPMGDIRANYTDFSALRSDGPGNYLYHTFAGSMLGAFILAGPDAGIVEVSIDGGEWRKVDLFHPYSKALNYPRSVILADDLSGTYHTAAIRTSSEKNPASQGHAATFLYFEVSE